MAGRFRCCTQSAADTPEAFIKAARPCGADAPYLPALLEGAKAVQLAEFAYRSVAEQRWMAVSELKP